MKFKKFLRKLGIVALSFVVFLGLFWAVVNIIPSAKVVEENPWIASDKPMISAHRGGAELNPENTKMAFDYVINETTYTDAVEFDVKLCKEDANGKSEIVIVHDDTLNNVALPEGSEPVYVHDLTYEELCNYNLGRNFTARDGSHPYENYTIEEAREAGLTMMTLEQFLDEYKESRDFKVLLEVKESDNAYAFPLVDKIMEMLAKSEYDCWDERIMIITINDDVVDYMAENYPTYHTGAIGYKIAFGIIFNLVKLNSLYTPNFQSVQTKMVVSAAGINLDVATKDFIRSAHARNQSVAYWTINEVSDMELLISIGADIITTDAPDVLYETIQNR